MKNHQSFLILASGFLLCPAISLAQTAACSDAYEKAQEEKANDRLNAAIAHLRTCVDQDCPKFIRDDCTRWIDQAEAALPSVVFSVRRDGTDQMEVEVTRDGTLLIGSVDGKAIPVDPGLHTFSFKIPGFSPIERQLLIREGERNRIIAVEFQSPRASTPLASAVRTEDTRAGTSAEGMAKNRLLTYGLAGIGALGVAGFTAFAILGKHQQGDLEKSCSPNCQSNQVDSVKMKYLVADTCLGVGLVSLGVATYLYISSRGEKSDAHDNSHPISVGLVPRAGGAGGVLELSTPY